MKNKMKKLLNDVRKKLYRDACFHKSKFPNTAMKKIICTYLNDS